MLTLTANYIDGTCQPDARRIDNVIWSTATSSSQLAAGGGSGSSFQVNPVSFLSSPNYPDKYYWNADCRWRLVAQQRQTIRLTMIDFELDVRRDGVCHDTFEIVELPLYRVVFRDCGALGKLVIESSSNEALVRFTTGHSGQTQRGFLLHFEGISLSFVIKVCRRLVVTI